jgi:hypothetical protein
MPSKERFCWYCGESLGVIDSRYYDRMDTCGKQECERELRDALRAEREEAHRKLDERNGWDDY